MNGTVLDTVVGLCSATPTFHLQGRGDKQGDEISLYNMTVNVHATKMTIISCMYFM